MKRDWTAAHAKLADEGHRCRVCGSTELVDPAHVIPRSRVTAGGEDPRNIVPLCRLDHMAFDAGHSLDLLPYLSLSEQGYAAELVGIAEAFQRCTNQRLAA